MSFLILFPSGETICLKAEKKGGSLVVVNKLSLKQRWHVQIAVLWS